MDDLSIKKKCNNCINFPCLKTQCRLGQIGCEDYESIISSEIKKIGRIKIDKV